MNKNNEPAVPESRPPTPFDALKADPTIDAIEYETGGRIFRLERGQPLVEYTGRALEDRCAARLTVPK